MFGYTFDSPGKNSSKPTSPPTTSPSTSPTPPKDGRPRRLSVSKIPTVLTPKSSPQGSKSPPSIVLKKVKIYEEKGEEKEESSGRTKSIAGMFKQNRDNNPFAKSLPPRINSHDSPRYHTPPMDFMKGVKKNRIDRSPENPSKSQLSSPHETKSVSSQPLELFQNMDQGVEHLILFASHLQQQVQECQAQMDEFLTEENKKKVGNKEQREIIKNIITEKLGEKWNEVQDLMYEIFFEDEFDEEEGNRRRSISFSNLGLEHQLDAQDFDSLKSGLKNAGKNFKGEKHLEVAYGFITKFLLDFKSEEFYKTKANRKKLEKFGNEETEMPCILFNYMISLNYLGEILKNPPSSRQECKDPHLKRALRFIKQLKHLKEIRELDQEERAQTTKAFCNQCGRSLISYSKTLAKRLGHYVETSEKNKNAISLLSPAIDASCITSMMTDSYLSNFESDFDRAISRRFFTLSGGQYGSPPEITSKIIEDHSFKNERLDYCKKLLSFLYKNLGIDQKDLFIQQLENRGGIKESILAPFNPLELLNKEKSLGHICLTLEQEWKKTGNGQFKGIFKLLPFMRMFHQGLLLNIHNAIMYLERELTGNQNLKIVREYQPDGTKRILVEFNDSRVRITFWRSAALDKLGAQRQEDADMNKYCYTNCLINSTVTLSAPIENLENWEVEKFVEIEKPLSESSNIAFLKRFSELIATLETMDIRYSIKEV